ncbi:hypothetical protein K435DRAFT_795803 [Dendrothele bispora CBS 962.96]|uniref:Major facilitator superfamily (MFS) profile domain-containing protein n=1 Tax=Dendrothele bispora (strain CBS 962.96) TaxID=1314807 RepID=A0A4S8M7P1_DENBC|nr:hypothetical protein K435DRAFT_795803 [Dendrothele bispora CBS 962.96]
MRYDRILFSAVFGVASVVGPLIAGAGHSGLVNPPPRKTLRQYVDEFDFLDLFLIMAGIHSTIAYNTSTLVQMRTTTALLLSVFIHGFGYYMATYCQIMSLSFDSSYFQILGSTVIIAGIEMMPFSFGCSIVAIISGRIVARTGKSRELIWGAYALMTLEFGLMIQLDESSNRAEKELYILVAAIGVALHASMPVAHMATLTAAFGLVRTLSCSVGLSVGNVIFANSLENRLKDVPE